VEVLQKKSNNGSASGVTIVSGGSDGALTFWELDSGSQIKSFKVTNSLWKMISAIKQKDDRLLFVGFLFRKVCVFDVDTCYSDGMPVCIQTVEINYTVWSLELCNSKHLLVGGSDGTVQVFDWKNNKLLRVHKPPEYSEESRFTSIVCTVTSAEEGRVVAFPDAHGKVVQLFFYG